MIGSANPFVGPRPLGRGESLYGRDKEVRDLDNLLAAERIVLLHSPSGAGKSSLLQAGLLPRFKGLYDVWGPTRLNQEPRDGVECNRYALSAMQGFEEGIPERLRRPPEELARQTLAEYVKKRPHRRSAPDNLLLLFDQFEEVLTADPLAVGAKEEFFDQLGKMLHNPRVWALFALREDYLAPLDPYARRVPSHLRNRFRIDLLGLQGARDAMVHPARQGGREFPAADQLVRDLALRKVQKADGSFTEQTGHHVEPVQLQVVCRRLWQAMPDDKATIDAEDLERFGDVNLALTSYYADSVQRISGEDEALERNIREWFDDELITAGGIRIQVLRGPEKSGGLRNDVIAQLLDTHLVRAEQRAGATWYELAHDRLVGVVLDDNRSWRDEHLSEVQRRAGVWERQGQPTGLLLTDEELAESERWAAAAPAVTEVEKRFLEASREARKAREREKRQVRRIKVLAVVALIVGVLALIAGGLAVQQMIEAKRQREAVDKQRVLAEANAAEAERQRAEAEEQRLLAVKEKEAADRARRDAVEQRRVAEEQKRFAVEQTRLAEENERVARVERAAAVEAEEEAVEARRSAEEERRRAQEQEMLAREEKQRADENAAENERLRLLAEAEGLAFLTTSMTEERQQDLGALLAVEALRLTRRYAGLAEDEGVTSSQVYNALRLADQRLSGGSGNVLLGHHAPVRSVAVAADGKVFASGDEDGEIHLVDLTRPQDEPRRLGRFGDGIRALAWSPEGRRLAAGGFDGTVRLWDFDQDDEGDEEGQLLMTMRSTVHALAFYSGSVAIGTENGALTFWKPGLETPPATSESDPHPLPIRALAVSPDGVSLATAGEGVTTWEGETPLPLSIPEDEGSDFRSVTYSHDGRFLAAGSGHGTILLWPLNDGQAGAEPVVLRGHRSRVVDVEFHPRRNALVSASLDGELRLWDVGHPDAVPLVLEGHRLWVWSVAFTPDGKRLISASEDRSVRLWSTSPQDLARQICERLGRNLTAQEWGEYLPNFEYEKTCPHLSDGDVDES